MIKLLLPDFSCFFIDIVLQFLISNLIINCHDFYYIMELHSRELHSMLKQFFLNLKGLFDAIIVSLTKRNYGSEVHFL